MWFDVIIVLLGIHIKIQNHRPILFWSGVCDILLVEEFLKKIVINLIVFIFISGYKYIMFIEYHIPQ